MLLLSVHPVHILYSHKFNIVSSFVTIILHQWWPISWQGIALILSWTAQWFRFFWFFWNLNVMDTDSAPLYKCASFWCNVFLPLHNWMFLKLSLSVFLLFSSDEVVVTYSHDLTPKNIAPLASFPIAFVKSSSFLSNSFKSLKGRQAQCRVFGYLYLYPRMNVVIKLNILFLASRVGSLTKFALKIFSTSPMVALTVPTSKVELVALPYSLHLIECVKATFIALCWLLIKLVRKGSF